jgi:cbb3-type cytochrome oxidase maturation protein
MSVMFVLLPVALAFAAGALGVFLWAARTGQFDDLDTPPVRILVEDDVDGRGSPARATRSPRGTEAAAPQ